MTDEQHIKFMHQPHAPRDKISKAEFDRLYSQCPSHESAFDEDDFKRVFGAGDERPQRRANIYRKWDDSGHGRRDFE